MYTFDNSLISITEEFFYFSIMIEKCIYFLGECFMKYNEI